MATTNYGTECPDCGAVRSRTMTAGLDTEGHRIRHRQCEGCERYFTTVEVAIPFSFSAVDALKREYRDSKQPPRRTLDYFVVAPTEGALQHLRPTFTIALVRGRWSNRCRKGLHELAGDNVYVNKRNGQRVCQACRRESAKARYRHMMDNMPQSIREERNRRNREYLRKRYAEGKRSRRKVA